MAKKALSSGVRPAAKRATNAAVFALTQESFDVAFNAGRAFASAYADAAAALAPLLSPLSAWVGEKTPTCPVVQWAHLRAAFVQGMAAERAIMPGSAERAWQRIVDDLGLTKPQSAEAAKKAAARAAKRGDEPEGDETPLDGSGEAAASAVQMALSPFEAHIVTLLRAGKTTMAAQAIAESAAQ